MSLVDQLSSAIGQRSESANRRVAALILSGQGEMDEIIAGLQQSNANLTGDCAEICAMVAQEAPELVLPFNDQLWALLDHQKMRVRWEAMHALALLATLIPLRVREHMPQLIRLFQHDSSTIVRDYTVKAAANLAGMGSEEAAQAKGLLYLALSQYNGKHAKLALEGLAKAAVYLTKEREKLLELATIYEQHPKPSIRKAAHTLLLATEVAQPYS